MYLTHRLSLFSGREPNFYCIICTNLKIYEFTYLFTHSHTHLLTPSVTLMGAATGQNRGYIDQVFMQEWTSQKLETFYALFFIFHSSSFTKGKEICKTVSFRCLSKNQFKSFKCDTCDKTWKQPVKVCYQQVCLICASRSTAPY